MPLVIPDHYEFIKLIGIDPGLNNSGVALLDQDYRTGKIVKIEPFLLISDKLKDESGMDDEVHPERAIKLMKLGMTLQGMLRLYNPHAVGCEAPFFNRFRPMAYGALCEVVTTLQFAVIAANRNTTFSLFPPLTVKKGVAAKSVSNDTEKGKLEVKRAIMANPEIMAALQADVDLLSEHELDAVAVAYVLAKSRSNYHGW